jgi:hypothetical protein
VSKFTPGPWEVARGGSYKNGKYQLSEYFVRRPEDDVSIAADIIDPATSLPSKANAALIAASPDLLAGCEAACDLLKLIDQRDGGSGMAIGATLLALDAAITKARGND